MSDDLKTFASLALLFLANAGDAIDRAEEETKEANPNVTKIQSEIEELRKHLKQLSELAQQKIAER